MAKHRQNRIATAADDDSSSVAVAVVEPKKPRSGGSSEVKQLAEKMFVEAMAPFIASSRSPQVTADHIVAKAYQYAEAFHNYTPNGRPE